jgi:hypothetical protein
MSSKSQVYISIDVETNGPIPGPYSMLSLGAVAFDASGTELSSWYQNFDLLDGSHADPKTQAFWEQNKNAYDLTRICTHPPSEAMTWFVSWVRSLPGTPVAVASPAGFDFTWVYWYLIRFTGSSPFSFSCIDVKTMVMTMLKLPYRDSSKQAWKASWQSGLPHTHHALSDAREQGVSFCKMLQELHTT